jgi:periplasmic protein TonB
MSPLQFALGASIAVHVVLLTVRFVDPQAFNRVFEDTPLEVILVNAHTGERPVKAQAIAQAAMAGGGDAEQGRTSSPLPPALLSETGDDTEAQAQLQLQQLQERQNLLLAQVKAQLAALPTPDLRQPSSAQDQIQREERRRQLSKLLAEIERRISQENKRPRKRYIGPATREEVYAVYYDHLRRRIEDKGTDNFPEVGGKKLYGELTMGVTVDRDGRIHQIEIVESSGNRALDRRAEAIVRSAAPFGRFNLAMRRQADQIWVVSRFKFTRDETLETRLTSK